MANEKLKIEYVPLSTAKLWEDNLKLHDIGAIIISIKKHGFKDPPKFEPKLNNGAGGFVEGNGRTTALAAMKEDGDIPPRGILVDASGEWLIPTLFGVDAKSEAAAKAYGVDHNATTISGGDYGITDHIRMWDDGFVYQLVELQKAGETTATFDADAIQSMIEWELANEPPTRKSAIQELADVDFWPILRGRVSPAAYQKIQRLIEDQGGDIYALSRIIEAIGEDENISG